MGREIPRSLWGPPRARQGYFGRRRCMLLHLQYTAIIEETGKATSKALYYVHSPSTVLTKKWDYRRSMLSPDRVRHLMQFPYKHLERRTAHRW